MEEMIIIPKKELPEDVQFYKGQLQGNALMNEAGRLGAKKKRLLLDKSLTPSQKKRKTQRVSAKLARLNKRLRGVPLGGGPTLQPGEEDEGLVTTALEKWMNRLVRSTEAGRAPLGARPTSAPRQQAPPPTRIPIPKPRPRTSTPLVKRQKFNFHNFSRKS